MYIASIVMRHIEPPSLWGGDDYIWYTYIHTNCIATVATKRLHDRAKDVIKNMAAKDVYKKSIS